MWRALLTVYKDNFGGLEESCELVGRGDVDYFRHLRKRTLAFERFLRGVEREFEASRTASNIVGEVLRLSCGQGFAKCDCPTKDRPLVNVLALDACNYTFPDDELGKPENNILQEIAFYTVLPSSTVFIHPSYPSQPYEAAGLVGGVTHLGQLKAHPDA